MGNKRNKRSKRPHSRRKTSIYRRKLRREAALRLAQENEALERGKLEGDNQERVACWEGIVKVELGVDEEEEEETTDGTPNLYDSAPVYSPNLTTVWIKEEYKIPDD